MARGHRMTPKRRAALRKAQAASARKRRGRGKGKLAAAHRSNNRLRTGLKIAGAAAAIGAVAYGAHHFHGHVKRHMTQRIKADARARLANRGTHAARMQHADDQRAKKHAAKAKENALWAAASTALGRPTTPAEARRSRAHSKAAAAARGTSGHGQRKFTSHAPKKDPHARHMRILAKAAAVGHYHAGLSTHGGKAIVATRRGASHRRR